MKDTQSPFGKLKAAIKTFSPALLADVSTHEGVLELYGSYLGELNSRL